MENRLICTETASLYDIRLAEDRLPMLVRECVITYDRSIVTASPDRMADWVDDVLDLRRRTREVFCIVGLDNRNCPIGLFFLTQGTSKVSLVSARDVFLSAISIGAVKIPRDSVCRRKGTASWRNGSGRQENYWTWNFWTS